MHEESSYEGLDPIECEVRRRTFWLLFGGTFWIVSFIDAKTLCLTTEKINLILGSAADKSMSILLGRPICLRDEDCTVHFPKELDDE
jgi:hypothetical protein